MNDQIDKSSSCRDRSRPVPIILNFLSSVGGTLSSPAPISFQGVSTDSRTLKQGELFVALVGPHFDGHQFVEAAKSKGAVAAMVSRPVSIDLPLWLVDDTQKALGQLALAWRRQYDIPIVAVTGSCGKTTVKQMIAAILQEAGTVLYTQGNLNNEIGVPLTLLRLQPEHQFAVIEMGASKAFDISYLTHLAEPTVAILNNAAPAHLSGFGSLEGIARAKAEIFEGLAKEGVAIFNCDDTFAPLWQSLTASYRSITFGVQAKADVTARHIVVTEQGSTFSLITPQGSIEISLSLLGQHNVMNALAAASAVIALGIGLDKIQKGLLKMVPVSGRLVSRQALHGARLIDDTYNANPTSMQQALEVLAGCQGQRILVLGDMAELGENAQVFHREVGKKAKDLNIHACYAVGPLSAYTIEAFGGQGYHFDDRDKLIAALQDKLSATSVCLVKGSRVSKMDEVVKALSQDYGMHNPQSTI